MVSTASAHEFKSGDLSIGHPYARPTAPSQPTGGGYLTLTSKGRADRLLSASTPIAREVQLHSMKMEGDVMRMREVDAIEVPADTLVELKPGGFHLMFVGLKEPLKVGQQLPAQAPLREGRRGHGRDQRRRAGRPGGAAEEDALKRGRCYLASARSASLMPSLTATSAGSAFSAAAASRSL